MGVTVWTRAETAAPQAPAAMQPVTVAVPATAPPSRTGHRPAHRQCLWPSPARHQPPGRPPRPHLRRQPLLQGWAHQATAPALRLHAPQLLYPTADPAQTPPGLGAGWLIVTEGIAAADPLGGDAGKLLDNMLRAMQLHRHPRVFVAALERPAPGARTAEGAAAPADVAAALAEVVTTLQPALVLVLGHVAARAALGRTEPLGRLRAVPHTVRRAPGRGHLRPGLPAAVPRRQSRHLGRPVPCTGAGAQGRRRRIPRGLNRRTAAQGYQSLQRIADPSRRRRCLRQRIRPPHHCGAAMHRLGHPNAACAAEAGAGLQPKRARILPAT